MPKAAGKTYFASLDGLRGVVALVVVVYHMSYKSDASLIFPRGYLAVDFFFILSGFVIHEAYGQAQTGRFIAQRFVRLYPMILISGLLGLAASGSDRQDLIYFLKQVFVAVPVPTFDTPSLFPLNHAMWSMFFEVVINYVYILLLRRLHAGPLLVVIAASLAGLVMYAASAHTVNMGWGAEVFFGGFARVGFSFTLGVLISRYRLYLQTPISWYIPAAALLILFAVPPLGSGNAAVDLLIVAVAIPLILCVSTGARLHVGTEWMRFLGNLSYPLYLAHQPLLRAAGRLELSGLAGRAATLALVVCASAAITLLLEVPLRRLLARSVRRRTGVNLAAR